MPPTAKALRETAEAAEKQGKWEQALGLYLKAYLGGEAGPELRERIRVCFRNLTQLQRYRDPAFQEFLLSLPPSDALALYAEALGKIQALYPERTRATVDKLFAHGLDELDRALGTPEFVKLYCPDASELKVHTFRAALRGNSREKLPGTVREARHVARDLLAAAQRELALKNPSAVVLELLCGACSNLDEFSAFVAPGSENANEWASPILQLAAYGILVAFDAEGLSVENIVPDSWASFTPLERGQRIAKINGIAMGPGANPAKLRDAMKSAAGSLGHAIEVTAPDPDFPAASVHLPTPVPTVYGAEILKDGIGYVRLGLFRETTPRELEDTIDALKMRGLRALILDVRGNPGGSLTACLEVSKRFLPAGIILTTQGQSPEFANRVFSSDSGMSAHDFPVVLLVDTKTMSAAEIFAASLKDNARATLVGLRTFGKGLIQSPVKLQSLDTPEKPGRSGSLYLSVGSTVSPRGNTINDAGIEPHVVQADPHKQLIEALNKAVEAMNGVPVGMR
jgi:carboxyl-terminal processing protease